MDIIILLPLLLLQSLYTSATRYGSYCTTDSDCDQHQKCIGQACRCNVDERRFWTGEICAICVSGFTTTYDRCYKRIPESKTWPEARAYCRALYADLFTWRNNNDEQFIRPLVQDWIASGFFKSFAILNVVQQQIRLPATWAGAVITSINPYTVKWVDPDGIRLTSTNEEWCDPTIHSGYTLPKEPTSGSRKVSNGTEREECVTFNFGNAANNVLCLADDYCTQTYPFICEMNAASMKLASTVLHGSDDGIDFEEQAQTPDPSLVESGFINILPESLTGTENAKNPSALAGTSTGPSMTMIVVLVVVGILLIVGAIVGYMFIKKRKQTTDDLISRDEGASQGRPSFTSSVGSMVE